MGNTDDTKALRDHFAGLAMQGFLRMALEIDEKNAYEYAVKNTPRLAYLMADGMLEERGGH